jgi:ATP-dependent Clp protease ATP-binding subunit ClpB
VARALLRDGAVDGSRVSIDMDGDQFVITHEMAGTEAAAQA